MRSAGRLLPPQQRPYGSSRIAQMTWHPEASSGACVALRVTPESCVGVGRGRLADRAGGREAAQAAVDSTREDPEATADAVHNRRAPQRRHGGGGRQP